jgi:PTH2 family peptidyl-tRNA hydrolase
MPCALIEDAGVTEFHGEITKTCCSIGPGDPQRIDEITGRLKLL